MEDKIWYLKQINILKSLNEKDLMDLGEQCSMMQYSKGEQVYLQQENPNIYFIKSGNVKIVSTTEDGSEHLLDMVEAGEIFGKFVGAEANKYEQVIAVEDCLVCFLPFDKWQTFIQQHAALSYSFIKWIGLRIKRMERKMDSLYFKNSRQRIAEQLQDIANRFGRADAKGNIVVSLNITHDEMGQLTGTSRQGVNAFMNELKEKGLVEYSRNKIIVKRDFESRIKSISL